MKKIKVKLQVEEVFNQEKELIEAKRKGSWKTRQTAVRWTKSEIE